MTTVVHYTGRTGLALVSGDRLPTWSLPCTEHLLGASLCARCQATAEAKTALKTRNPAVVETWEPCYDVCVGGVTTDNCGSTERGSLTQRPAGRVLREESGQGNRRGNQPACWAGAAADGDSAVREHLRERWSERGRRSHDQERPQANQWGRPLRFCPFPLSKGTLPL